MDWFNQAQLQVATLQGCIQRYHLLEEKFSFLSLNHTYKECNSIVDGLSKEALMLEEGKTIVVECEENYMGWV